MTHVTGIPESERGRLLHATAGETLGKRDRIQLVFEYPAGNDEPVRPKRTLVAYKARVEGHYHGTCLNDAIVGMDVIYQEHIIQEQAPEPDLLKDFTPILFEREGVVLMLVEYERCPICHRPMIRPFAQRVEYRLSPKAQMERADIVRPGDEIPGSDRVACEVCTQEGKIVFTCAFCGQERRSDLLHESHPEPVCTICYNTLTAAEWEAKEDALHEEHRYDYD